ncbi:MAG: hypothetical protein HOV94_15030 [Saccharothrix sp.]|nr:hypothetical protein [Saccharothrix sp.]
MTWARFDAAARSALDRGGTAAELAAVLYDRWYAPASGPPEPASGPNEVTARYRAADAATGRFEPGWTVLPPAQVLALIGPPASGWQIAVSNGAEIRWADPIDVLHATGIGLRPQPGSTVSVTARRDSTAVLPGWWTTTSPAWPAGPSLVRLYWSVEPKHVHRVIATVTATMDAERPWALKCPLDLDRCRRPDAVVLYLPAADWDSAAPRVAEAHRRSRPWLRQHVPALTLELAGGLGLAEDPGDDSFGASRCRMLAESAWRAHHQGARDAADLRSAAEAGLEQHGISAQTPWLNPGSTASYPWPAGSDR